MPNSSHELQSSQPGAPSATDEGQRPPGSPSGADENQRPSPGLPRAADKDLRPPAASPSPSRELQLSPPASRNASPEMQGNGLCRHRTNGGATADAPSSKRRKVERQVDGAGLNRRRSNRDRRPTKKAAEER